MAINQPGSEKGPDQTVAHAADSASACSNTVSVALSCPSGGYFHFLRIVFTINRSFARTESRTYQSTELLARSLSVSSRAIFRSVGWHVRAVGEVHRDASLPPPGW
jgi:hypothetical protein